MYRKEQLIVLLLPGLTSSSRTSYVKTLALSIANYGGAIAAVVNNRGLGGVPLKVVIHNNNHIIIELLWSVCVCARNFKIKVKLMQSKVIWQQLIFAGCWANKILKKLHFKMRHDEFVDF